MMKIVPASRFVSEASLEPANSERSRVIAPAGGTVADCASITAKREFPWRRRHAAVVPAYQLFVKIRWPRREPVVVAPAKAEAHNHRARLLNTGLEHLCLTAPPRGMGPGLRRDDKSIQIDIELVGAV